MDDIEEGRSETTAVTLSEEEAKVHEKLLTLVGEDDVLTTSMADASKRIAEETGLSHGAIRRIRERLTVLRLITRLGERSDSTWTIRKVPLPEPLAGRKSADTEESVQPVDEDSRLIEALEAEIGSLETQLSTLRSAKDVLARAAEARRFARSLLQKKEK